MSLGILLGEKQQWRISSWKQASLPIVPVSCLLAFVGVWCIGPLLATDKKVMVSEDLILICPHREPTLTIAFLTNRRLDEFGREARAAASLGLRALIAHPEKAAEIERKHGKDTWFVSDLQGDRHISREAISAPTGIGRGVRAVRRVFDVSGMEASPTPDKPFPVAMVIGTLYLCGLAILIWQFIEAELAVVAWLMVMASVPALMLSRCSRSAAWQVENREVAEWARQMRSVGVPQSIYEEYVLSPDVAPDFSIRSRRTLWYTFYQNSRADDPAQMLDRVKEAIDVQVLIRPDPSPKVRQFADVWRTRTCNLTERWYFLAAVLRSIGVPARIRDGRTEIWARSAWLPAYQIQPPSAALRTSGPRYT